MRKNKQAKINFDAISEFFLLFFFSSVVGWFCEIAFEFLFTREFVNRGFLRGPYVPVYGTGVVLLDAVVPGEFAAKKGKSRWKKYIAVFLTSLILFTAIEYMTGVILETAFHETWWDYSGYRWNFQGRICFMTSVLFGLGGVAAAFLMIPRFKHFMQSVKSSVKRFLAAGVMLFMGIDFISVMVSMLS